MLQIVHNSYLFYVWLLEHMKFEPLYNPPLKKLVFWYYLSSIWNGLDLVFILTISIMNQNIEVHVYRYRTCQAMFYFNE